MKAAIRTFLLSKSSITGIVGTRIYSFPAPQNATMPYIMISRTFETPGRNLVAPDERYRESWQIDAYASTDTEAESIKEAVRNELDLCTRYTMGDYTIYNSFMQNSNDLSELENAGGQESIHRKQMDFIIIRKKTSN